MRIAVMSDFHFGFNEDSLDNARKTMEGAVRDNADFIIMAGDLFDYRIPKQETINEAIKLFNDFRDKFPGLRISEIKEGGRLEKVPCIPLVGIYGTHERRSKGMVNVIQVMHTAQSMINVHGLKLVVEKNGERIAVQGMGGVPEEFAAKAVKQMDFKPVKEAFNVFIFHQTLREIIPADEEALSAEDLPEGFDLYVNGHIHWAQEFTAQGKRILLPGSTVVTQMKKNETKKKGYYLFDTYTGKAAFHTISSRSFFFEELRFKEADTVMVENALSRKLEEISNNSGNSIPLVKIKLFGTLAKGTDPSLLQLRGIEEKYSRNMQLSIDNELESPALKEKIELIRRMRSEGKDAREMGLKLLHQKLREKNLECSEELFESLVQGELEPALEL